MQWTEIEPEELDAWQARDVAIRSELAAAFMAEHGKHNDAQTVGDLFRTASRHVIDWARSVAA